jgi:hypothetical protein
MFFSTAEFIASTGNSIKGPITNTSDITGRKGKVTTAIASETGEFLADVVNINGIILLYGNFTIFPTEKERQKTTAKNINNGGSNFINSIILPDNNAPWDENIETMARQSSIN